MTKVKSFNGLPPNFDSLPLGMKRLLEEAQYRRQLKVSFGYCPGDPRLTSMREDGLPLSGQFGKRVEGPVVEEDEHD